MVSICEHCGKLIDQIDTGQWVHVHDYDADMLHVATPCKADVKRKAWALFSVVALCVWLWYEVSRALIN